MFRVSSYGLGFRVESLGFGVESFEFGAIIEASTLRTVALLLRFRLGTRRSLRTRGADESLTARYLNPKPNNLNATESFAS